MQRIYTTADYEVKQGRFLILSTLGGDKYTEVAAQVLEGSDEAYAIAVELKGPGSHLQVNNSYWIHEGFIIVNSHDSCDCALTLCAGTSEEANESLTRFLAELNDY